MFWWQVKGDSHEVVCAGGKGGDIACPHYAIIWAGRDHACSCHGMTCKQHAAILPLSCPPPTSPRIPPLPHLLVPTTNQGGDSNSI